MVPATGHGEVRRVGHRSVEERKARGKVAREQAPLSSHHGWEPADDRADPVAPLEEQNRTRDVDLVPVRHGRMLVSPFTFYRGAAKVMVAAFTMVVTNLGRRTGIVPRWLVAVGYETALVLLLAPPRTVWATMLFRGWVLLVTLVIIVTSGRTTVDATTQ
jgi:hypothetical protein